MTSYKNAVVDGSKIFYREAGPKDSPAILLLHGFPTSSHMFRNLIPALAERYHVVAPDLPGFGFSDAPDRKQFRYTFEQLAKAIDGFTQTIGLERYAIYVFDYGAPVGLRLALAHPERITAIISQNGNAYEEGLSQGWNPIQKYWKEPTPGNRAALRDFLTPGATKSQYLYGVQDDTLVAPEAYALDSALLARPGNDEIQLDLFLDYASNVALYPKFQEYFRVQARQPERRGAFLRHWPLRARNPRSGDCECDSGFLGSQAGAASFGEKVALCLTIRAWVPVSDVLWRFVRMVSHAGAAFAGPQPVFFNQVPVERGEGKCQVKGKTS
jgi:pimeloyl-ACP methyl ester carboxylesterase